MKFLIAVLIAATFYLIASVFVNLSHARTSGNMKRAAQVILNVQGK